MKKNCLICGKEFKTLPSRIKKGWGKYCSLQCNGRATKGRLTTKHSGATEKECTSCRVLQPISEYRKCKRAYSDGSIQYQSWCKECRKIYDKEYYQRADIKEHHQKVVKRNHIEMLKKFDEYVEEFFDGIKCIVCGKSTKSCLDFHHKDPTQKLFNISSGKSCNKYGINTLKKEVVKCIILCSNCHRKFHAGEIELPSNCGVE